MTFGEALELSKERKKIARKGWNEKGLWLEIKIRDANSRRTLPYGYLHYPSDEKYPGGCIIPWFPSKNDLLEDDWEEVE